VAPFAGVNTSTTITAQAAGAIPAIRANNYGEYVYPGFPNGPVKITATCEGAQVSSVGTIASGGAVQSSLTLSNVTPTVQMAYAISGGHMVRSVAPGTNVKVTVEAQDGGGFPLHYKWFVDPPVSGFVSQDAPTVSWQVSGPGLATIYVVARDGQGGNVLARVGLSTTPNRIAFSGRVTANDVPVVTAANVSINGISGVTNSQGQFLIVLPKEEPRYVVMIEKTGYQMLSRILYAPVTGSTFKLFRAQDFTVDPTNPINITERLRGGDQKGVQILIDGNSIAAGVDGSGNLATGPLHIRAATYDMHNPENQMPGDYAGTDTAGKQYRLGTYGSADIEINDAAGGRYNLAPGKTATLRMPIDSAMLANAPATIAFWHYDTGKKRGQWIKDGTAMRVGDVYKVETKHFSAVNMDLAYNDGACTIIFVDTGIMPVPFKLRMTTLSGNAVQADHQNQQIGDPINVVVREPPNTQVQFDVIDSNGNVVANASQTFTTGAASPSGLLWDPPPNPPYTDCTTKISYNANTVKGLFPAPPQGFLTFRTPTNYLDANQAPGLAADYYQRIDPNGTKTHPNDANDFAHWKTLNGFDRPGETHVIYENEYDLGFGRDMHMQKGGQTGSCTNCIAYYVTNYSSVEDAVSGTNLIATVAMEFSPQDGVSGSPYTKFYVFGSGGAISNSADLDGNGAKFVPTLCIVCHNGNIGSIGSDGNLTTARFIPFDLESFRYHPTEAQWSRGNQESAFKEMNRGIMDKTNVSAPLKLLITSWYGTEGDINLPNAAFNDIAVPSQWTAPTDESPLYNAVVKKSCRSCHTTRDPGDTGIDISWQSFESLDQESVFARILTCSPSGPLHHVMPQAQRTFARFWLSTNPNGPLTIANSNLSAFHSPNNSCQ